MKCFLPCFGSCKGPKHTVSEGQTHATLESAVTELTEQTIDYITQSKVNLVARSNSSVREKVTADLNINISKELSIKELFNKLEESKREQGKAREDEMLKMSGCIMATAQSKSSKPSDTRRQVDSENEKKRGHDNGEVDWKLFQEETSESLFSLSIDCRKQVSADENAENEVDSLMPLRNTVYFTKEDSNLNVSKILNPIENFAEEKIVKGAEIQTLDNEVMDDVDLLRTELQEQSNGNVKRKVSFDLNVIANDEQEKAREETIQLGESPKSIASIRLSSNSSDYRYKDCPNWGHEDINLYESDFGDTSVDVDPGNEEKVGGEVNGTWWEEESSESLFSVSVDSRKQISAAEKPEYEVNSPISVREKLCSKEEEMETTGSRIQHASSLLLNPVENPTQWKFVKPTIVQPQEHEEKENINTMQDNDVPYTPKPSLKPSNWKSRKKLNDEEQQIEVDSSLSSWLVEPKTRESKNSMNSGGDSLLKAMTGSPGSQEGRAVLGALTIEKRRQFSASTSPDEKPIIGTFGSYWSHIGQAMDFNISSWRVPTPNSGSKSTDDVKQKRKSDPFNARLDGAFDGGVAGV